MVNVDMVGRLRQDVLTVYGTRTFRGVRRLLSDQNQPNLAIDFNWEMKADSDHYSFYERQIPILMFHHRTALRLPSTERRRRKSELSWVGAASIG